MNLIPCFGMKLLRDIAAVISCLGTCAVCLHLALVSLSSHKCSSFIGIALTRQTWHVMDDLLILLSVSSSAVYTVPSDHLWLQNPFCGTTQEETSVNHNEACFFKEAENRNFSFKTQKPAFTVLLPKEGFLLLVSLNFCVMNPELNLSGLVWWSYFLLKKLSRMCIKATEFLAGVLLAAGTGVVNTFALTAQLKERLSSEDTQLFPTQSQFQI